MPDIAAPFSTQFKSHGAVALFLFPSSLSSSLCLLLLFASTKSTWVCVYQCPIVTHLLFFFLLLVSCVSLILSVVCEVTSLTRNHGAQNNPAPSTHIPEQTTVTFHSVLATSPVHSYFLSLFLSLTASNLTQFLRLYLFFLLYYSPSLTRHLLLLLTSLSLPYTVCDNGSRHHLLDKCLSDEKYPCNLFNPTFHFNWIFSFIVFNFITCSDKLSYCSVIYRLHCTSNNNQQITNHYKYKQCALQFVSLDMITRHLPKCKLFVPLLLTTNIIINSNISLECKWLFMSSSTSPVNYRVTINCHSWPVK